MIKEEKISFGILLAIVVLSSGCSNSNQENLQEWMVEQKNSLKPKLEPVNEPKVFVPQLYESEFDIEPFDVRKLTRGNASDVARVGETSQLIESELRRRKEPLEAVPLDTMKYVGSLEKKTNSVALLKVDQLLYQVKTGGYLGQNYGKIIKINEAELMVREIVQDAAGEWVERMAILKIQEEVK